MAYYLGLSHENYLSLRDILVTEEAVSCVLQRDYPGLGYIHPSVGSPSGDLLRGPPEARTILDLPLWMARDQTAREGITVRLPKAFQQEARRILNADPAVVDLGKESAGKGRLRFSDNFYSLGLYLLPLTPDSDMAQRQPEKVEIKSCVVNTFRQRFRKILDRSNSAHCDILPVNYQRDRHGLDRSELQLLDVGKSEQRSLSQWLEGKSKILTASPLAKDEKLKRSRSLLGDIQNTKRVRM